MLATTAAMIEQFNKNNILILEEMGFEIHVVGNWEQGNPVSDKRLNEFKIWLGKHHGKWFHVNSVRNPFDIKNNLFAYWKVVDLIKRNKYEFIHCHTPIGSVIGRIAAYFTQTKIIYTAHGFHFFKGAPLKNWILYYPIEWICSWMTDVLITINREDFTRAKKWLHAKRIKYVPGVGVDVEKFASCLVNKEKKCRELGISKNQFILLSVGELQENKNQSVVIEALNRLKAQDICYLIVGKGHLEKVYEKRIEECNLSNNVKLLGFREDVNELYAIADCFIHPSFREGLPVAMMEAMASGLPILGSEIRGNVDLLDDGVGGFYINNFSDADVAEKINQMKKHTDTILDMGVFNQNKIKKYDSKKIIALQKEIYSNIVK